MKNTRFIGIDERERYRTDKMDDSHDWLGLVVEDELVGYVEFHDDGDNELFIDMIKVEPIHQKKGYSMLLLNELKCLYPGTLAFTGESTPKAVPYWTAKAVLFEPMSFKEFDEETDMEGVVFPFAIPLSTEYRPYWTK